MSESQTADKEQHQVKMLKEMIDGVDERPGWKYEFNPPSLHIRYRRVPLKRLQRDTWPGIDANFIGRMWMLMSGDSIGHGLGIEHQGILNHGKTVDCQHLDDAISAVENGMVQVEKAVGRELRKGHETNKWASW